MLQSLVSKPRASWMNRLLPVLVVIFAAVHLYCPPARVAELEVIPDSVEYAVAGHEFATTGKYVIHVNGRALPPRYPPGFSVAFLAPIYALAPGNLGNGIFAVWIAGIAAALFAYLLGNKLAGPWGGTLAAIFLLHHPQFADYTQVIMTDVPAVALGLIAGWLYLRASGASQPQTRIYSLAGIAVALSISIRPLTGLLVLPFLFDIFRRRRSGMWRDLIVLALPCALAVFATGFYQWRAMGDWRRTGYQLWLAVPYDYASLTFSPRYLKDNFAIIAWKQVWLPMLMGLIGATSLLKRRSPAFGPIVQFIALAILPLSAVHLFYFFTDIRFHFLALSAMLVLAAAGIAMLIPDTLRQKLSPLLPLLLLSIFIPSIAANPLEEGKPIRQKVARAAGELLPQNAILISRIDPAYLEETVARGTSRRIIPLDRQTQYASAVISFRRVENLNPPPKNAADHACAGLLNGGAEKLYPFTADEEIDQLKKWIRDGVPVYLELLSTEPPEKSRVAINAAFQLEPVSSEEPWLVRLRLPE